MQPQDLVWSQSLPPKSPLWLFFPMPAFTDSGQKGTVDTTETSTRHQSDFLSQETTSPSHASPEFILLDDDMWKSGTLIWNPDFPSILDNIVPK